MQQTMAFESRLKMDSVQREILGYFGNGPEDLQHGGASQVGYVSLSIGKGLVWISGHLDPRGSIYEPVGQRATSVGSLGKQFQEAGLCLLDQHEAPDRPMENQVNRLRLEVQSLRRMVLRGGVK